MLLAPRPARIVLGVTLLLLPELARRDGARGQAEPAARRPENPARPIAVAGRVVDGLKRPVAGVAVQVHVDPPGGEMTRRHWVDIDGVARTDGPTRSPLATFMTDADGRFAGAIPPQHKPTRLDFDKEGYESISGPIQDDTDRTMRVSVRYATVHGLSFGDKDDNVRRLRGFFASAEWTGGDEELHREFFKYQADLRPLARRLVTDSIVGPAAKGYLADLADPADKELVAAPPPAEPLPEIREDDLIEAIRATARRVNWFTRNPEPTITMKQITLTPDLDRAQVECGINVVAMTGVFWRFVFHREGKRWVLKAMEQTGRA